MDTAEQARVILMLNGTEAGKELDALRAKANDLTVQMQKLQAANDLEGFAKAKKEYQATERSMKQLMKQVIDVDRVMSNLSGSTLNELVKVQRRLTQELKASARGTEEWAKKSEQLNKVTAEINKVKTAMGGAGTTGSGGGGLSGILGKIGPLMAGAFTLGAIKNFVRNVISVRQEFEKYEAVLRNTLGSASAARMEMGMLKDFAAETPFQLNELTGAYVKLVNQGFQPTREELTKLGDLSASTGKDFDQLAEAIIDAQTGEFERLKEFGIKASKQGDQVKFTFKGVTTEVGFTNDAIRQYILSLGDMKGVSGSMAAISETLGGRISNMKDAWDSFLNTIGSKSSGIFATAIYWITSLAKWLEQVFISVKQIKESVMDNSMRDQLKEEIAQTEELANAMVKNGRSRVEANKRAVEMQADNIKASIESYKQMLATGNIPANSNAEYIQKQIDFLGELLTAYQDHYSKLEEIKTSVTKVDAKAEESARKYSASLRSIMQKLVDDTEKEYGQSIKELNGFLAEKLQDGLDDLPGPFDLTISDKQQLADYNYWLQESYDGQLEMLRSMHEKGEIGEKEYADKVAKIHRDMNQKKTDSMEQYAQAAIDLMTITTTFFEASKNRELKAAGDNEKKREEIEKRYAEKQKAVAIAQTLIEGVVEIARINSNAGVNADLTQTLRAVLTGLAVARTAANIAMISSQELYSGGYTGPGGKYEPAGVVHKGEYVIPQEGVYNPGLRPILNAIESARVSGTLSQLNLSRIPQGYAQGGLAQLPPASDPLMLAILQELSQFLKRPSRAYVVYNDINDADAEMATIKARSTL